MANITVEEFAGIGEQTRIIPAGRDLIASQAVAIGATSASTASVLNAATTLIRVFAEADCYITMGTGTLDADDPPRIALAAGQYDYFSVHLNSNWKVACIERTV